MKRLAPIMFGLLSIVSLATPASALPVSVVALAFAASTPAWVVTVATVFIDAALSIASSALINALFKPNPQRQASIATLAIGEQPRTVIFGVCAVPGLLA